MDIPGGWRECSVPNLNTGKASKVWLSKVRSVFLNLFIQAEPFGPPNIRLVKLIIIIQVLFVILCPVTKIENIKTDATKILRPTHFGE